MALASPARARRQAAARRSCTPVPMCTCACRSSVSRADRLALAIAAPNKRAQMKQGTCGEKRASTTGSPAHRSRRVKGTGHVSALVPPAAVLAGHRHHPHVLLAASTGPIVRRQLQCGLHKASLLRERELRFVSKRYFACTATSCTARSAPATPTIEQRAPIARPSRVRRGCGWRRRIPARHCVMQ